MALTAWLVLAPHSDARGQLRTCICEPNIVVRCTRKTLVPICTSEAVPEGVWKRSPVAYAMGFIGPVLSMPLANNFAQSARQGQWLRVAACRGRRLRVGSSIMHVRCLNRLLLDPWEVQQESPNKIAVVLPADDKRVMHVRNILKSTDGKTLRIGVVDAGTEDDATVQWQADGALKLSIPGDGSHLIRPYRDDQRPRVDLLLALPRPSNIAAFLHVAAQMGVSNIILCNAKKVQADYFGSHFLRPPQSNIREALKAGLEQSGDVALPTVLVAKKLKVFLEDELDSVCPDTIRIVAHPQKDWLPTLPAIRQIAVPPKGRLLVAVGPEAGWDDPYELDLLAKHGFQPVSLG